MAERSKASLLVWDAATGKVLASNGQPFRNGPVTCLSFLPGGRLAVSDFGGLAFWDSWTGKRLGGPDDPSLVGSTLAAWSSDGLHGVMSPGGTVTPRQPVFPAFGKPGTIFLCDRDAGRLVPLRGHSDHLHDLALLPSEREFASASRDGTVRIWPIDKPRGALALVTHPGDITHVAFCRDGSRLVSVGGGETQLRDASDGRPVRSWPTPPATELFARNHRPVFDAAGSRLLDARAAFFDTATGRVGPTLEGAAGRDWLALEFAPGGRILGVTPQLTGSSQPSDRRWDVVGWDDGTGL